MTFPIPPADHTVEHLGRGPLGRDELAAVVARDIPRGSFV
jgi:3-oxoadipate CoA-transferase beta subunit